ncbi:PucR family transcriptional regulator [Peribacillus huizhouensis]|nr:helix-turn-helix domain-containing protein [Peribacillus huizhouensis]
MMLEKLLNKFPNSVSHKQEVSNVEQYLWFRDDTGFEIGIPKTAITPAEINLLSLLFHTDSFDGRNDTFTKLSWSEFLLHKNGILPKTRWEHVRFTHFHFDHNDFSYRDFEQALLSFVSSSAVLIWTGDNSGTLIEGNTGDCLKKEELIAMLQTLESDFYTKIEIFLGCFHLVDNELASHYEMEKKYYLKTKKLIQNQKMIVLADLLPFIFLKGMQEDEKKWFITQLLGETLLDKELIGTVKTYIECNSNASLAAKTLYIHRNSLQYRIDKFIDKTGLDVRAFNHALPAYLLILLSEF